MFWAWISDSGLNHNSIFVAQERSLDWGEWGAISRKLDEWERINSVIPGELSQGQRRSHTIHPVWEALQVWEFCEKRYLVFVNSQRRIFFSSTSCCVLWCVKCTSLSSGAVVPTETKAKTLGLFFVFFFAVLGLFLVWPFLYWDKWGLLSACRVHGFSLRWLLLLWSTSSRHTAFSSFAPQAQYLSFISLVAPWHVRSSHTKNRTHVSCISKLTFYYVATRVLGKFKK